VTIAIENLDDRDIFDNDDLATIKKIERLTCSARDKWDHDDFKGTYKKLKTSLLNEQDRHCFYCQKQYLSISMDDWHIDHIVPIDEDSRFTFCDRNLVVACKWCNRLKNDKPVLVNPPKTVKYSKAKNNYRVVHPRYDTYSTNIDILGGQVYVGKTPKGRRTVHDCVLDRFILNYLSSVKSSDRSFVEGALTLLLSGSPKRLIDFIKALP
jgi:uncharacterized protein (TIGR02646 family)